MRRNNVQIQPGMVVRSCSGHDKDRFYLVIKTDEAFVWIADGKRRKLAEPKRKKPRHLLPTDRSFELEGMDTDRKIRRALHEFNYADTVTEQGGKPLV